MSTAAVQVPTTGRRPRGPATGRPTGGNVTDGWSSSARTSSHLVPSPATVFTMGLRLSQIAEADELLTNDPLALLICMVLEQRAPERTSGGVI